METEIGAKAGAEENNWYAVYTNVRHEKSVNRALFEKDINTFLPLRKVISRWKDRNKRIESPLFPGYLFVYAKESERLGVLKTKGVIRILGAGGRPVSVPGEQIESLRALMDSGLDFDTYPYFTRGKQVYLTDAPLSGMTLAGDLEKKGGAQANCIC